jgi:hypothetical protein
MHTGNDMAMPSATAMVVVFWMVKSQVSSPAARVLWVPLFLRLHVVQNKRSLVLRACGTDVNWMARCSGSHVGRRVDMA